MMPSALFLFRKYSFRLLVGACATVASLLTSHGALAQTVIAYTTLTPDGRVPMTYAWTIADVDSPLGPTSAAELSVPFTAEASGFLQSVELPIARKNYTPSTTLRTFSLALDAGGRPGAVVESWSILPGTEMKIEQLFSVNRAGVAAGTKFWFTAHINPTGTAAESWPTNELGLQGPMLYRRSLKADLIPVTSALPAFRIKLSQSSAASGICGPAAKIYSSTDTSFAGALCSVGTANPASPTFPAIGAATSWQCKGLDGGSTATCSASRMSSAPKVNGMCGVAAKTYAFADTSFSGALCSAGTASPASPAFPAAGGSASWQCRGANGGANANCTATRVASSAVAIVAYTTLSPTNDLPLTFAWTIADPGSPLGADSAAELAASFISGASGLLLSIELPIMRKTYSAASTTSRTFSLAVDSGGRPGSILESWTFIPGAVLKLEQLASAKKPTITSGAKYWLTAHINPTGTAAEGWPTNEIGLIGPLLGRRSLSTAYDPFSSTLPAFRVKLTQTSAMNGACGTAARTYASTETFYTGEMCAVGTASPTLPTFPAAGASTSWQCLGSNGGANMTCTASRGSTSNERPRVTVPLSQIGTSLGGSFIGLEATFTDDGVPNAPLQVRWVVDAGPANALITVAEQTTSRSKVMVGFSKAGIYTIACQAFDGALTGSASIQVTVSAAIPGANLGPTLAAVDPANAVVERGQKLLLKGSVVDDGRAPLGFTWREASGKQSVTFSAPTAETTEAVFGEIGDHLIEFVVDDNNGQFTVVGSASVKVHADSAKSPHAPQRLRLMK